MRAASTAIFLAATMGLHSGAAAAADSALHRQLERVAAERVFFAHQSVGQNLLEGLARIADEQGVPLHIEDLRIPENGDPLRKLRNFERDVDERGGALDVAMLKFCYVDIGEDTDVPALFEQYRATLRRLQVRHPRIAFVHVTVPLTVAQEGVKAFAKRLLGRHPYGTVENLKREEYNALLRAAYLGREPVFDLARVESVAPDGRPVSVTWKGRSAPALAPQYSADGAHLNAAGKEAGARELLRVLAAAGPAASPTGPGGWSARQAATNGASAGGS
ncbi:MAG: hypothetical protein ACM30H_08755 [Clostridia bacterium]